MIPILQFLICGYYAPFRIANVHLKIHSLFYDLLLMFSYSLGVMLFQMLI